MQLACTGAALVLAMLLTLARPAHAEFGVAAFDGEVTADAAGTAFTQAGGHPYALSTQIDFNTRDKTLSLFGFPFVVPWPVEPVKDILVDIPPGLVGNPTVVAECNLSQLAPTGVGSAGASPLCPPESQVGLVRVGTPSPGSPDNIQRDPPVAVYKLVPPPNVPAEFGFNIAGAIVTFGATLRSDSDYGLSVTSATSEGIAIDGTDLTLWGTPADPAHDADRFCAGQSSPGCPSTAPQKPFLTLPTACTPTGVGLETKVSVDSWVHPGDFKHASFFSHLPPSYPTPPESRGPQQGPTGCDKVPFDATLTMTPDSLTSPGAAGYAVDLTIPQDDDPVTHIAPSHLKKATVTLPEGVRVSPSAAEGLKGCSPAQIGLDTLDDPTCPPGSRVGSLTIDTPLLEQQLTGAVYLATPNDNPSDSLIALYLVAKGPGLIVKIPGSVSPSGANGQLSATFDNNPQVPFSHLHLQFDGGPRAPLSNPPTCGTYTTHAVLTSWSGKTVTSDSSFTTSHDGKGAPCPAAKFSPSIAAGTVNPVAGASSPFTFTLSRSDDDDEFAAIKSIKMPKGLLARIAQVGELCPAAKVTAGTCASSTQIGTATAAAGPGPNPFAVRGKVYLGGAYNGAPFSLSIVVPAIAGPFDLGTIVVRSAIFVDKHTAELHIATDPLPTILQGIPLQVRLVNVTIDRPGFMLNPTSCAEKQISAEVQATTSRTATPSTRFQVGNCDALDLNPKMTLKVGGKGHTHVGDSTPFTATLRMPKGGSNLKMVSVTLPLSLNARLPVVENACTVAEFDAGHCEASKAGTAVAVTPLLEKPLKGSAYFVKNPAGGLPNLTVALRGQVDFDLVGKVTIPKNNRLSTRFNAPDVPFTKFTLKLASGKHGAVGVAENLCTKKSRRSPGHIAFSGQNGDRMQTNQRLTITGCPKGSAAKRIKHRAR